MDRLIRLSEDRFIFSRNVHLAPVVFLILISYSSCLAQVDSLKNTIQKKTEYLEEALQTENDPEVQIELLNELSKITISIDANQAINYAKRSLEVAKELGSGHSIANSNRLLGDAFMKIADFEEAKIAYKNALAYKDDYSEILSLQKIGQLYTRSKDYDSAEIYLNQGLAKAGEVKVDSLSFLLSYFIGRLYQAKGEYSEAINQFQVCLDKYVGNAYAKLKARALSGIGVCYYYQSNYEKAIEYYILAAEAFEEIGDWEALGFAYYNIALLLDSSETRARAMDFQKRAAKMGQKLNHQQLIGFSQSHIGSLYRDMKDFDKAMSHYEVALEASEAYGDLENVSHIHLNFGITSYDQGKFSEATDHLQHFLELNKKVNHQSAELEAYGILGEIELKLGQYDQAISYAKQMVVIAEKAELPKYQNIAYNILYQVYADRNQYEQAFKHLKLHKALSDSIFNEKKFETIERMEKKYDFEKKERENSLLRLETSIANKTIQRQRLMMVAGIIILLLVIGFAVYAIRSRNIRKRLHKSVEESRDELQKLNLTQSRWFTNIAHELRTPLTLITGPVHHFISQNQNKLDKEALTDIKLIEKNGQRLIRLVNEILDFSKLESGELKIEDQVIDLNALITRLVVSFHSSFQDKGILSEIELLSESLHVKTDIKKLDTIIVNLIGNALKFTGEGGQVKVSLDQNSEGIHINVADTGIGIKASDLSQIFNRYYQVENTDEHGQVSQGGSGIGLALSQELALLLGGEIQVSSEWGKGTTFSLQLPVSLLTRESSSIARHEEENYQTQIIDSEEMEQSQSQAYKPTILLVEDNADMRQYITRLLSGRYQIREAIDGLAALHLLTKSDPQFPDFQPDLIISDIMMPRMDGLTFAEQLKAAQPDQKIPFVFLTARAGEEDKLAGLRIGVDDYITKPFKEEELLARIDNLMANAVYRHQAIEEEVPVGEVQDTKDLPPSYAEELLSKLQQEVENHINDSQLSVETLAEAVGMHKKTLTRTLKKTSGLTPGKFIRDLRLQRALRYLEAKTYLTVNEVAYAVGFESPSNFTQAFNKRYGKKPSEYLF